MSNHNGNANKMVSDTPRTDAAEKHAYEFKDEYTPVCESKLVRKLERELNAANDRIKRLEGIWKWIPANAKPEGYERKVLLWIVWPSFGAWCDSPEPLIGWWKHGPKCFALGDIENADHLVRYWMELPDPTEAKEAKP